MVDSHWPTGFDTGGYLLVGSLLAPKDLDRFYGIAKKSPPISLPKPVSADELTRNAVPIREQVARASTGNVYWMFLLEGATRDPRIAAAALSIQDDISAVTAADVQRLARQYRPRPPMVAGDPAQGMALADASALDAVPAPAAGGR